MQQFRCYRLHDTVAGRPVADFDDYVDLDRDELSDGHSLTTYGPASGPGFDAKLYLSIGPEHLPTWADFLRPNFGGLRLPRTRSIGATMIVRLQQPLQHFAFTFGTTGRHLLKDDAWRRAYGTRAALNVIFEDGADTASILAIRTKRRGAKTLRSESQSSSATTLETFGADLLRDVFGGFTGVPFDHDTWGSRVTGGDSFTFQSSRSFTLLRDMCADVESAAMGENYRRMVPWLEDVQPVSEPDETARLEAEILRMVREQDTEHLDLAPPEMVDWQQIVGFTLPDDKWRGKDKAWRPDLRIVDVLRQLQQSGGLDPLEVTDLKRRHIGLVNDDGNRRTRWSLWRCLVAEFQLGDTTYVLDEGEFFVVDRDYLVELNRVVDRLRLDCAPLPAAYHGERESPYLLRVSRNASVLLLHEKTVRSRTRTTPIEVCDVLTAERQLIHVKRHLGSSDLSHLFAQGSVSAQLLQEEPNFRIETAKQIAQLTDDPRFEFFNAEPVATMQFEVLYAIIAEWRGRTLSEALPLFSKVNLRTVVNELSNRLFKISCYQVPIEAADEE